jgi:O-antigen/teichoic acid export membrane protein
MGALENKAKNGLIWSSIDKFSTLVIQFVVGIILARLLIPEDFGLIGMISILLAISQCLVNGGFYTALLQKKKIDNTDYSTIFFFNVGIGFSLYLILFWSSSYIAEFYEEPMLIALIKVIAINIVILSTTIVHRAILARKIDFKTQAIAHITSSVVGGGIGIYCALNDYGVWALVFQYLSRSLLVAILYWLLNRWTPSFIFSKKSFKSLFSFGSKLMISELLKVFFKNLYIIIIGKIYKAEELGYFTRADLFKQVPGTLVGNILQSVTFPLMVKVIDDDNKVKNVLERSVKLTGFVLFPVIFWLLFFAKPLIIVLLTDKWLASVVLLQILSLDIVFHPIQYINLNFLNAKGRSDLFLKLEMTKNILTVMVILLTYKYGLIFMSIGYVSASFVSFFINSYYTGRFIGYTSVKQLRDLLPYAIGGALAVGLSYLICFFITTELTRLLLGTLLCGLLYFGVSRIMNFKELNQIKNILVNKLT